MVFNPGDITSFPAPDATWVSFEGAGGGTTLPKERPDWCRAECWGYSRVSGKIRAAPVSEFCLEIEDPSVDPSSAVSNLLFADEGRAVVDPRPLVRCTGAVFGREELAVELSGPAHLAIGRFVTCPLPNGCVNSLEEYPSLTISKSLEIDSRELKLFDRDVLGSLEPVPRPDLLGFGVGVAERFHPSTISLPLFTPTGFEVKSDL
ncbi:hypothetical protein EBR57_00965 [bacterium]|nr:hypothetical protein [bacterium]